MPYRQDANTVSLFWGRTGAAILLLTSVVLQSFGYTFGPEDQAEVFNAIQLILLNAGALVLIVLSKIRETKKVNEAAIDLQLLEEVQKQREQNIIDREQAK